MTAGLAAGMGLLLDPDTIVAESAKKSRQKRSRREDLPIDTFVVLMMENRSFDHYTRLAAGGRRQAGGSAVTPTRPARCTRRNRLNNDFRAAGSPTRTIRSTAGRTQFDNGKMDGFLRSGDNDAFSIGLLRGGRSPVHPEGREGVHDLRPLLLLADGVDLPEPLLHARGDVLRAQEQRLGTALPDTTIFAALEEEERRLATLLLRPAGPRACGAAGRRSLVACPDDYTRAAAGTLWPPLVVSSDPSSWARDQGTSGDEHPHGDVRTGQAFMSDVVNAVHRVAAVEERRALHRL